MGISRVSPRARTLVSLNVEDSQATRTLSILLVKGWDRARLI
jgi:hypothetical protein